LNTWISIYQLPHADPHPSISTINTKITVMSEKQKLSKLAH